ncbi:hypothetical protein [Sphingomonas radiodurans]|uniref:hypothetical protein n=1 Tax=Sphingomonas radiodurans TaxID=2890321 RepID=UPI001E292B1E|nr:hypothetical protein [Sphingomonas radiodurans]WBH17036.1 hypothetical protein LLW23_02640 [Sphingomonas radiodurans]
MTLAGALALLRRFWWSVPIAVLTIALLATRATLADRTATLRAERDAWSSEIRRAEQLKLEAERRYATNLAQAATNYAGRISAMQPIIVRSINTTREYAQTDAGLERVREQQRPR